MNILLSRRSKYIGSYAVVELVKCENRLVCIQFVRCRKRQGNSSKFSPGNTLSAIPGLIKLLLS